jgi:hypothetical protein
VLWGMLPGGTECRPFGAETPGGRADAGLNLAYGCQVSLRVPAPEAGTV